MRQIILTRGIPLAVDSETGHLRLIPRGAICHGYQNACVCPGCRKRQKHARNPKPPPRQPWEPAQAA